MGGKPKGMVPLPEALDFSPQDMVPPLKTASLPNEALGEWKDSPEQEEHQYMDEQSHWTCCCDYWTHCLGSWGAR